MSQLTDTILESLGNMKLQDIKVFNVQNLTVITDWMVLSTGNSVRHICAAANILTKATKHLTKIRNIEGTEEGSWVLIDLNEIIIHIMTQEAREFYQLEKLWADANTNNITISY